MRKFNFKKSVQALNFFATKSGGTINKMKALKLIWLADRLHLRQYGRPIILDYYIAMENGPVASATRDILQKTKFGVDAGVITYSELFLEQVGQYEFRTIKETDLKVFSKSDIESLETIFDAYGKMDKYKLRDLTHEFPEWNRWEDIIKSGQQKSIPMEYADFFLDTEKDQPVFHADKEDLELTKDIFLKNS